MNGLDKSSLPAAPPHLKGTARNAWDELCILLTGRDGFVADYLHPMVEIYAVTYGRWRAAIDLLEKEGAIIVGRQGGAVKHPSSAIAHSAGEAMARMLTQLGFTSTSAKKVERPVNQKVNPFAELNQGPSIPRLERTHAN